MISAERDHHRRQHKDGTPRWSAHWRRHHCGWRPCAWVALASAWGTRPGGFSRRQDPPRHMARRHRARWIVPGDSRPVPAPEAAAPGAGRGPTPLVHHYSRFWPRTPALARRCARCWSQAPPSAHRFLGGHNPVPATACTAASPELYQAVGAEGHSAGMGVRGSYSGRRPGGCEERLAIVHCNR
jgi:hypothetical protein